MKQVLFLLALLIYTSLINSKPLEDSFPDTKEVKKVEFEPQEPVALPGNISDEDGDAELDCQGFFINLFGC